MFAELAAPIVSLLNQLMGPLLLVVGALGSLYCVDRKSTRLNSSH